MIDPTPQEAFFNRIGATNDKAKELAREFDSVAEFLTAPFEEKLSAVIGTRQAQKIAEEYRSFEHMRNKGKYRQFYQIEGVGKKSASEIARAYLRQTIFTPRDVLSAEDVAQKMGLVTEQPENSQWTLDEVVA